MTVAEESNDEKSVSLTIPAPRGVFEEELRRTSHDAPDANFGDIGILTYNRTPSLYFRHIKGIERHVREIEAHFYT